MKNALVSVIIPVYNSEKYLQQTIQSALDQTWQNIEIIVIDDGSTDGSSAIINNFQEDRIKTLTQANKGASAARNAGLRYCNGTYIQFLDGDDLISPDKIEKQVMILQENPNQLAVCATVLFDDGADPLSVPALSSQESFLKSEEDPVQFLIRLWGGLGKGGSMIQPNAWLTPKKLIDQAGPWNEDLTLDDDGEFFARVILSSRGIIKTGGYNYYRRYLTKANLSSQKSYAALTSLLKSALLKKKYLLGKNQGLTAKRAIYILLIDLAEMAYPRFMDLVKTAESNYPGKFEFKPSLGGKLITYISDIFGWKVAKRIKLFLKR